MSRRRAEGGFSLRTAFSAAATSSAQVQLPSANVRRVGVPNLPVGHSSSCGSGKLSFSLQGLQQPAAPVSSNACNGMNAVSNNSAANIPTLALTNAFARPAAASSFTGDTLRLNAVIDDLTQRLRKTTDKIQQMENANARTSQSFASAKNSAAYRITTLKAELATVVSSESKLRTELGAKSKVAETKAEPFLTSVRSALEADELEQRSAAAEKKCVEMQERQKQLSTDLDMMEGKRSEMMSVMAGDDPMTASDLEDIIAKAKKATRKLEKLELRRSALEDEVSKFGALADARREDAAAARRDATMENAKVDEAEANLKTLQQRSETAGIAEATAIRAAEQALKLMPVLPNTLEGAEPGNRLNRVEDSNMARIEMAAQTAIGIPFHFQFDAPIGLGAEYTNATIEQPNEMIDAVVKDLTAYFQNAVLASTPIKHGVANGGAAIALAAA